MRTRAVKTEIDRSVLPLTLTILGQIPSSKNRRRIVGASRGRPMLIKSADAMAYEASFLAQIAPGQRLGVGSRENTLAASIAAIYPDWRSDVEVEIVYDLLQKAGVIANDRWIRRKLVTGLVSRGLAPGCIITVDWL